MYNSSVESEGVNMQVNSISSVNNQSFGNKKSKEHGNRPENELTLIDFANMSDNDLKRLSYAKASKDVNDKKFNRVQNGIYYSIPIAAGLREAISDLPKALFKPSRLRGARLALFGNATFRWLAPFAAFDAVFAGKHALEKHNEKAREFSAEHPFLSLAAGIGAFVGVLALGRKGLGKLDKITDSKITPSTYRTLAKINKALNENKALNALSKGLDKVPSAIKSFAKGVIDWSPAMLIVTSLMNTITHSNAKTRKTYENYEQLKAAQEQTRAAIKEAVENTGNAADDID